MKRILIVEDEKELRDIYVMVFKAQRYEVHAARHGKEAKFFLPSIKPDIIVLDILMPHMGGIEFLETAKLKEDYPDTKVLVLSNLSDQKTLDRISQLGASKYVLKASLSPNELLAAVEAL